jgi:hypothetical protein
MPQNLLGKLQFICVFQQLYQYVSPVQGRAHWLVIACATLGRTVLKINPAEIHYIQSNKIGIISQAGNVCTVSYSGFALSAEVRWSLEMWAVCCGQFPVTFIHFPGRAQKTERNFLPPANG